MIFTCTSPQVHNMDIIFFPCGLVVKVSDETSSLVQFDLNFKDNLPINNQIFTCYFQLETYIKNYRIPAEFPYSTT